MFMSVLLTCMVPSEAKISGTGITDSCEPLVGDQEPDLCPSQEQQVLLTTDISSQPLRQYFIK